MAWVRPGAEFAELLLSFERSAWRWECQGTYREPDESEPLQAWREGRPDDGFLDGWLAQIRQLRATGRTFERVRMLTDPPTEYLKWMISLTHRNVEAGEDIRWIDEHEAREFDAPRYDFYLLDDRLVAQLHFDATGLAGAEVTNEPGTVIEHRRWRDVLRSVAVPHDKKFPPTTRSP